MAYIYTAGGFEIEARGESRESLTRRIQEAGRESTLEVSVDFPAGNAKHPEPVTVAVAQIAAVSDQPLSRLPS